MTLKVKITNGKYSICQEYQGMLVPIASFVKTGLKEYTVMIYQPYLIDLKYSTPEEGIADLLPVLEEYYD